MREYEIVVIMRSDLSEPDLSAQVDTIKSMVTSQDGKINQVDHWGRRRLAYPISRQRDGYYVLLKAELPPALPMTLERNLRIMENVLRYLVVRTDE